MKKVLVITCILAVLAMSAAFASETKWAVRVFGSDTTAHLAGGVVSASGGYAAMGVGQTLGSPFANSAMGGVVYAAAKNSDGAFYTTVGGTSFSTWTAYVAANASYTADTMRITLGTATTANYLPTTVGGQAVRYALAINDVFETYLPILDSATTSGTEIWFKDVATSKADLTQGAGGYKVTLTQELATPVPEPSSMLALGSGLVGLAGFVIRRRRA